MSRGLSSNELLQQRKYRDEMANKMSFGLLGDSMRREKDEDLLFKHAQEAVKARGGEGVSLGSTGGLIGQNPRKPQGQNFGQILSREQELQQLEQDTAPDEYVYNPLKKNETYDPSTDHIMPKEKNVEIWNADGPSLNHKQRADNGDMVIRRKIRNPEYDAWQEQRKAKLEAALNPQQSFGQQQAQERMNQSIVEAKAELQNKVAEESDPAVRERVQRTGLAQIAQMELSRRKLFGGGQEQGGMIGQNPMAGQAEPQSGLIGEQPQEQGGGFAEQLMAILGPLLSGEAPASPQVAQGGGAAPAPAAGGLSAMQAPEFSPINWSM